MQIRALVLTSVLLACGGGKGATPDAHVDAKTIDAPRAAEANCFDGLDDNGDGLPDCADPTCATVAMCVAEIPADWIGYDQLFDGSASPPGCTAPFTGTATPGSSGLTAAAATCDACTCGTPANMTCDLPDQITVQDALCGNTPTDVGQLAVPAAWDGTCFGNDGFPGGNTVCGANGTSPCNVSVTANAPTVTGGSCAPAGGAATVPPTSFSNIGVACTGAPHGAGCTGTDVCQPKPAQGFESGLCIHHDGELDCPAGPFTNKHVFYTGVTDTRGCTACGCGAPTGATCAATIQVFSTGPATCTGIPVASFTAGSCANLLGNPAVASRRATVTTAPTGGQCGPTGGAPTGTAVGSGATTYCCIP